MSDGRSRKGLWLPYSKNEQKPTTYDPQVPTALPSQPSPYQASYNQMNQYVQPVRHAQIAEERPSTVQYRRYIPKVSDRLNQTTRAEPSSLTGADLNASLPPKKTSKRRHNDFDDSLCSFAAKIKRDKRRPVTSALGATLCQVSKKLINAPVPSVTEGPDLAEVLSSLLVEFRIGSGPRLFILPESLLLSIIALLPAADLLRVRLLNRRLNSLVEEKAELLRKLDSPQLFIVFDRTVRRFICFNPHRSFDYRTPFSEHDRLDDLYNLNQELSRISANGENFYYTKIIRNVRYISPTSCSVVFFVPTARWSVAWNFLSRLLPFLFRHHAPSSLKTNLSGDHLYSLVSLLPSSILKLHYDQRNNEKSQGKTPAFVSALSSLPHVKSLKMERSHLLGSHFFEQKSINELEAFELHGPLSDFNDAILLKQHWKKAKLGVISVTVRGVRELLIQWINGDRELLDVCFQVEDTIAVDSLLRGLAYSCSQGEVVLRREKSPSTLRVSSSRSFFVNNFHFVSH